VKRIGIVLLLILAPVVSRAEAQEVGLAVGSTAPAVTVKDVEGTPVNLGEYLGKQPLFLEWWATWCEQCETLLPRVRAAHAEVGDKVAFFGINVAVNQTPERVRRYIESHKPPFRTLYDGEGESTRAYAAPTTSYVVIVDRAGRVAYSGTGGEQDFLGTLRRVAAQ
jgi:peroxiredoxin